MRSALVLAVFLAACSPAVHSSVGPLHGPDGQVETLTTVQYPATPAEGITILPTDAAPPESYAGVVRIYRARRLNQLQMAQWMGSLKLLGAPRGATHIWMHSVGKGTEFVLLRDPETARILAAAHPATVPANTADGTSAGDSGGCVADCTVQVRGYTRRDGTYVHPHTRSAPRSRRP